MEEARQILEDFKNKVDYFVRTCKVSDDVSLSLSCGSLVLIRKIDFNGISVSVMSTSKEGLAIYTSTSELIPLEKCVDGYIVGPVEDKTLAKYISDGIIRIVKCTQTYKNKSFSKYLVTIDSKIRIDFDDIPVEITEPFEKPSLKKEFVSWVKSFF